MYGVERMVEYTGKSRFSIIVADNKVPMRITRVASQRPARWVGCFIARSESVHFREVTVVDSKESVEFPWKLSGGTHYLDRSTHDTMTFYLTMADIARLKKNLIE